MHLTVHIMLLPLSSGPLHQCLGFLKPIAFSFCSVQLSGERQLLQQTHSGDSPGFLSSPPSLLLFYCFCSLKQVPFFHMYNSPWKKPIWPCLGQYMLKKLVLTAVSDCRSSRKLIVGNLHLSPHLLCFLRLALLPSLCPFDSGFKTENYESCF